MDEEKVPPAEAAPDDRAADDHAYFQAIEEMFVGLRGTPFLLSPADWQVARGWHHDGVPLPLVRRCLETVFARRQERGSTTRVSSLRYCAPAVKAAWIEQQELMAPGRRQSAPPLAVAPRLLALAAALPVALAERARFVSGLEALAAHGGDPALVEERLATLDGEMLAAQLGALAADAHAALEAAAEQALTHLRRRIASEEVAVARERLRRQLLRARLELPVLSLFSPEAEAGDPGAREW